MTYADLSGYVGRAHGSTPSRDQALARARQDNEELRAENARLREENMLLHRRLGEVQDAVATHGSVTASLEALKSVLDVR